MTGIAQNMSSTPIFVLDGGLGTSLEDKYGVSFNSVDTPLWSSHLLLTEAGRATLLKAQSDYTSVPVDILSTATYQVSLEGFARTRLDPTFHHGVPGQAIPRILGYARSIAIKAGDSAQTPVSIALSLGPYGATMIPSTEYSGAYDANHDSEEKLLSWHVERLRLFRSNNGYEAVKDSCRYVAFETLPRVDEIIAVRKAVDMELPEESTGDRGLDRDLPFWISCVFPGDGMSLPDGSSVDQVVRAALDPQLSNAKPYAIGINCTKVTKLPALIELFEKAVAGMIEEGVVPRWPGLVLYPDGTNGEVYDTVSQTWEAPAGQLQQQTPWEQQFSDVITAACSRGKWRFIFAGGCCKSTHEDIRRLRSLLEASGHIV